LTVTRLLVSFSPSATVRFSHVGAASNVSALAVSSLNPTKSPATNRMIETKIVAPR
jgi:hypothetical protein